MNKTDGDYGITEQKTCKKDVEGCYCLVGFPYEEMCPECRDTRNENDIYSRCVCGPEKNTCGYNYPRGSLFCKNIATVTTVEGYEFCDDCAGFFYDALEYGG